MVRVCDLSAFVLTPACRARAGGRAGGRMHADKHLERHPPLTVLGAVE